LTDWNPDANGVVNALIVSGTTVYIGGNFTNVGGASRNRIAALDATLNTSNATSWNPNADNTVNSLMMSGSTVYAGGDFLNIGSEARTKVAALSVSTGLATLWNPKAGGAVLAFSEQSGKIFAGGGFTIIGGHARNRLAAINTNTGEATAWNPDADGLIYSMAINDGSVYVCGTFNTIGGVTRTRVASIDATTGSVNSFAPVIASGDVRALAFSGGLIYIGGTFTSAAGTARNRMAAFNISSGALTSWDPGANNTIRAFGINGETLYVGGDFTTIGGGQTRNRIAAVSLSDGTATSWNPNANDIVLGLLMDNDQIFAGGNFTTIGGQTRNRIAALSISSGLATSWNPNINGSVSAFAMSGGAVFAGRSFTTVGSPSITRNRAAGIFKTSGQLMSWNPNSNGQVNAFDIINDRIYMAGSFTQLGNQPCSYFASFTISSVSWGGSTGGNFSDAANWAPGIAPSSTMDVAIPHGSSILDTDHTIPSTKSLTISGTGSMSLAAGKTLTIAGTADFGGKSVTLMSSAVGTAAIGQVTGTLSNATNVTVERYLPAGRKWRLLGAPLTGGTNNSIFYNWQNNDIPNGSTGVEIWGPEGSADPSSANTGLALGGGSSMRTYNVVWQNVTNTNSSLLFDATTNYGYALFQTGPYNNGSTAYIGSPGNIPAAVSTTLSATGTLITGTHTKTFTAANAGQYFLVANPYASPVDPASFTDAGTINRSNLGNTLYMWDAKPGGTSGLGRYVSYDISAGQYSTFGAGTGYAAHTTPIQSGQAFFVRAINAGAASLTFRESSKGSISSHDMMGDARPVAPSALRFQLLQDSILYDGAVAYFHAGASRSIDQMDGFKLQNGSDNLGLRREGKTLVFEHHPELTVTDTLFLHLGQMRTGAFTLRIEGDGLTVPEGMVVRLVDKRSGQETPIDVRRPTDVSFSIGTDSIGTSDRFMLIFKSKTGSAVQTTESIVSGILKVFPNPIAGIGNVNVTLDKSDAPWQILVTDLLGRAIWQRRQINEQRTEIPMSRFSVGTYHIIATSASGGRIVSELVRQ
jgi:hypothetical protein